MTKILGFQTGHDVSYCILENGVPIVHEELERFIRKKEPLGDGLKMAFERVPDDVMSEIGFFTLGNWGMFQPSGINKWGPPGGGVAHNMGCYDHNVVQQMNALIEKNKGNFLEVPHHLSHAANAFFTSNFNESLIVTIDAGGVEAEFGSTSLCVYYGKGNEIKALKIFPMSEINLGELWNECTSKIMGLNVDYPIGNQCGSVMAMATMGNPIYIDMFKPTKGQVNIQQLKQISLISEKEKFNVAASLQAFTEITIKNILQEYIDLTNAKNICFSGGVSLNCVMIGKIKQMFGQIENVFVDPVPYDSGLCLGSARYLWHCVLGNERIFNNPNNSTSFLGKSYLNKDNVLSYVKSKKDLIIKNADDDSILDMIDKQKIISVFGGKSESGRRALGNRSILADPRSNNMKDIINEKVKHRQWYRPFAPSILREKVADWFVEDVDSPYMSFAIKFKDEKAKLVPAVVHYDNTGRLQTVKEEDNFWYYNFLKLWYKKTGVPILLNTSFNDRSPIVETPKHAIDCFLSTDIDGLYFFDLNLVILKNTNEI